MNAKHENFVRISSKRIEKILEIIASFRNFSNTSFYDYSDEEIKTMFVKIRSSLDSTESHLLSTHNSKSKDINLN